LEDVLVGADGAPTRQLTADQAERLVLDLVTRHAESLLRVARRYSYCADDAQDAYQRAMEILLRHVHRLDPARAGGWLHTVVKHEALAVRAQRQKHVGADEVDLDRFENRTAPSPEEQVIGLDQVARAAEALRGVKANEAKAIWLKASGDSYAEICERTGWTYTKVNRCLAEGRRSFLERYAGIESGEECRRWEPLLSSIVDGEAAADDVVEARVHLRNCPSCRATIRQLRLVNGSLALLLPAGAPTAPEAVTAPAEATTNAVARIWDWLLGTAHDRAAGGVMRVHAVVEAATNHKMAAVAASAAALAGGGVVVEQAIESPSLGAPSALTREALRDRATPSLVVTNAKPAALRTPAPPLRTEPTTTPPDPTPRQQPRDHDTKAATRRPTPSEPLVDPVESQAPQSAPAPAPTPAPVAKPKPSPSHQPDANAEFGFES
jgi:RNA polymerase sigma factor (sigma-70 family)